MKFVYLLLSFALATHLNGFQIESPAEYADMDAMAIAAGADKGSTFHDYTRVYSNYLKEIRNDPIRFLEIGIFKGNSVKMWEAYLPNAELHFIDINKKSIEYHSTRSHYHFVDQESIKDLKKFVKNVGGEFDVIIDDGGHTMKQQINSLIALFPHVKSGGMYIIEDLHTSYWKDFGGGGSPNHPKAGPGTTIDFLKSMIDSVNAVGAKSKKAAYYTAPPMVANNLTFWEREVRSMHFYDSICILIKR